LAAPHSDARPLAAPTRRKSDRPRSSAMDRRPETIPPNPRRPGPIAAEAALRHRPRRTSPRIAKTTPDEADPDAKLATVRSPASLDDTTASRTGQNDRPKPALRNRTVDPASRTDPARPFAYPVTRASRRSGPPGSRVGRAPRRKPGRATTPRPKPTGLRRHPSPDPQDRANRSRPHRLAAPMNRPHARAAHRTMCLATPHHGAVQRAARIEVSRTPSRGFGTFQRNQTPGSLCAGLPRRHHPLSGFLTLAAVSSPSALVALFQATSALRLSTPSTTGPFGPTR
jgi:hypothetical protein